MLETDQLTCWYPLYTYEYGGTGSDLATPVYRVSNYITDKLLIQLAR